ncbi:MAG: hypothetical protein E7476_07475 [Ruminococcaceae bacterium]|nr:hypothetical protein [Oscillospiraceae bacterium]
MKKFMTLCLAVLFVFTLFSGCESPQKSTYQPEVAVQQEGFSIATELQSYPKDAKTINLLITNDSDNEYYYGYQYSIEMKKGEDWYVVPLKEEQFFIEIAVSLPPHTTQTYPLSLENFASTPKPGRYRVVFNQNYLAEFDITD